VTWTNNDDSPHTVTAANGPFDSGNVDPGGTFTFTFTQAGTYGYVCRYHGEMQATIIVTAPPDAGVGDVTAVNETEDPVESQSDQPDTAVPAPRAPTVWVPGLLIVSTGFVMSVPRYSLVLFGIVVWLALIAQRWRTVGWVLAVCSVAAMGVFAWRFAAGQWAF
jgi:hypothetical protein